MRGVGVGVDGDTGGSGASRGERGQRDNLHPPASSSLPLGCSSVASTPHTHWQPLSCYPSRPHSQAHILGVKGIVASTAELMAALGAVKVHAASSGQCIRELALGAVCKGQQVRARAATAPRGFQEESHWQQQITGQTGLVGQPYQCHFPEGTSPGPGPGILGHCCVSSSGNPHSSGPGAAPPTARREARVTWELLGPSTHIQCPRLSLWHCHSPFALIPN